MKFAKIEIKNFRNLENVSIDLSNKNVFFGMNDIGKTNLLYALRFIFDKNTRRNGLQETDYFQQDTSKTISIAITISLDFSQNDLTDTSSQKIIAVFGKYMDSDAKKIHFELKSIFDVNENESQISLFCGINKDSLIELDINGSYSSDIDKVFNVVYIDSYLDIKKIFNRNIKTLLSIPESMPDELKEIQTIKNDVKEINNKIQRLPRIEEFSQRISNEFAIFNNSDLKVSLQSEMAIHNIFSNLIPYLKEDDDDAIYPTSGEGRKKLLGYALLKAISAVAKDRKINIFLLEEPETNLHRSLQLSLSNILYSNNVFEYLFITTHSPTMLSQMDNVNLVRIFKENYKINSKSYFYNVSPSFNEKRKFLNKNLAESVFAKKVLLVEGPSEYELFSHVLSLIKPNYELDGVYILPVNGIAFSEYKKVYDSLGIYYEIKTDNDLREKSNSENEKKTELIEFEPIGFKRINSLLQTQSLPSTNILVEDSQNLVQEKRRLYDENKEKLKEIQKQYHLYLSKCSLEEDLEETGILNILKVKDPVKYLKSSKLYHMVDLISNPSFNKEVAYKIYNHENFCCLKELFEDE